MAKKPINPIPTDPIIRKEGEDGEIVVVPTAPQPDPQEGIDYESDEAKEIVEIDKKAKEAVNNGTSGLNATQISEVNKPLVKDTVSDRPVYETASQATAALIAAGELGKKEK